MRQGKKLFTFVEVDANTPIQKLSVLDQFRVLIKKMANDDAVELKADDAVTQNLLHLKADLIGFLDKAVEPIRQGKRFAVSVSISSDFEPVMDEVLQSSRFKNYYNITVTKPDIEFDVTYQIRIDLVAKE